MEDLLVLLIEILRFLLLCVVEWGVVWLFVFVLFFSQSLYSWARTYSVDSTLSLNFSEPLPVSLMQAVGIRRHAQQGL